MKLKSINLFCFDFLLNLFFYRPKQFAYKTESVRGKARLQLPGWSCKECEEVKIVFFQKSCVNLFLFFLVL